MIFQHAMYLKKVGYEVVIVPQEPFEAHGYKWHPAFDSLQFSTFNEEKNNVFDVIIATMWKTIYDLPLLQGIRYIYYVQSIETWFYPDQQKNLRKLVASTYELPITVVCVANWIRDYLQQKYSRTVFLAHNGIRKDLYTVNGKCTEPKNKKKLRVLVEGPLGIDFKNVARTIRLIQKTKADEIWLLTGRPINRYWGVDKVFSMIPIEKTPEIYRSCDVLVKLSYVEGMFGPPLEMFHCGGTSVVYDVSGYDEYIVHEINALVVPTGDEEGVISAVNRLKDDKSLLEKLKFGAIATADAWPDWHKCSENFLTCLQDIITLQESDKEMINNLVKSSWEDYCESARADIDLLARITSFSKRLVHAIERRIPLIEHEKRALTAWLFESRRLPKARSKD